MAEGAWRAEQVHTRVANLRHDALHQFTTRLVCDYGMIVIEDLALPNMSRNRGLARRIADARSAEIRRQLTYKTQPTGTRAHRRRPLVRLLEDVLPLRCGESQAGPLRAHLRLRRLRHRPGPGRERREQPGRAGGRPRTVVREQPDGTGVSVRLQTQSDRLGKSLRLNLTVARW